MLCINPKGESTITILLNGQSTKLPSKLRSLYLCNSQTLSEKFLHAVGGGLTLKLVTDQTEESKKALSQKWDMYITAPSPRLKEPSWRG